MLAHASTDMATHQVLHLALLRLFEAFGHMLLEGGLFHADPHAGNLLVQVRPWVSFHAVQQQQ